MSTRQRITSSALLVAALCACVAPRRADPSRQAIEAASQHLERGEVREAIEQSDLGFARATESGNAAELQRFAAAVLATRARVRGGVALSNLVAITMYADLARLASDGARHADRSDPELPRDIAQVDVERDLEYLELAEIAVHARLGFETSVARALEHRRAQPTVESIDAAIARTKLEPELVPALQLGLFRYLRHSDPVMAFRFGTLALDRAAQRGDVLGLEEVDEIAHWIEAGSPYEFHCPKCDLGIVPRLRACPNDQTPNPEFVAHRRD